MSNFFDRLNTIASAVGTALVKGGVTLIATKVPYTTAKNVTADHAVCEAFAQDALSEFYPNELCQLSVYPLSQKVAEQGGAKVGADENSAMFLRNFNVGIEGSKQGFAPYTFEADLCEAQLEIVELKKAVAVAEGNDKKELQNQLRKLQRDTMESLKDCEEFIEVLTELSKAGVAYSKQRGQFAMAKYRVLIVDDGFQLKKVGVFHKAQG